MLFEVEVAGAEVSSVGRNHLHLSEDAQQMKPSATPSQLALPTVGKTGPMSQPLHRAPAEAHFRG